MRSIWIGSETHLSCDSLISKWWFKNRNHRHNHRMANIIPSIFPLIFSIATSVWRPVCSLSTVQGLYSYQAYLWIDCGSFPQKILLDEHKNLTFFHSPQIHGVVYFQWVSKEILNDSGLRIWQLSTDWSLLMGIDMFFKFKGMILKNLATYWPNLLIGRPQNCVCILYLIISST